MNTMEYFYLVLELFFNISKVFYFLLLIQDMDAVDLAILGTFFIFLWYDVIQITSVVLTPIQEFSLFNLLLSYQYCGSIVKVCLLQYEHNGVFLSCIGTFLQYIQSLLFFIAYSGHVPQIGVTKTVIFIVCSQQIFVPFTLLFK